MGKHFSDDFHSYSHVLSSDEDQPVVMEIYAGITPRGELAVSMDLYDYDNPRNDGSTAAVVNTDDARRMARRHGVGFDDFPQYISECMAEWRELVNPDFRQVRACFKEIAECLLDEGCRFRIR